MGSFQRLAGMDGGRSQRIGCPLAGKSSGTEFVSPSSDRLKLFGIPTERVGTHLARAPPGAEGRESTSRPCASAPGGFLSEPLSSTTFHRLGETMTAFSDAFRAEVLRMARKEIKGELGSLRKTVTSQRAAIASLKRDVKDLVSQVGGLHKAAARQAVPDQAQARDAEAPARRGRRFQFKAEALAAKREQLGLSQQAMAALLEASALSVARWESGKVAPRAAQLERIRTVLKMGKREALAKLQP